MEPRHLRQLAEIIDLGSLSLAAKSLNVSQPTLSRNIKSLEALIGAPVLQRGRYGVTPTHIGATLAREGRSIRDALRQAELDLRNWKAGLGGRLRIGAGTMLAHSLMARFLADVRKTRWNVALRIDVESPQRLIDRVRSGELDLAIVQIEPYFPKEGLKQITLLEDVCAHYVGEQHPLVGKRHVTRKDIARFPQISVGSFSGQRRSPLDAVASDGRDGLTIDVSGDVAIALHLMASSNYIATLPEFVMEHLCDERRFVRLPFQGELRRRALSIWYREDLGGHPLIKDFCRRLTGYISALRAEAVGNTRAGAPIRPRRRTARHAAVPPPQAP